MSLQRRSANGVEPSTAPPIVHEALRSPGQPLDPTTRAFMEPRFGHDFSRVRVHTDAKAAESAQAVAARAYTVSEDIVYGPNQYAPDMADGKKLIAHELSHVVQQRNLANAGQAELVLQAPTHPAEREAENAARHVFTAAGLAPLSFTAAQPRLCRALDDPTRFRTVHQNLFVEVPGSGTGPRRVWEAATAADIIRQFKTATQQEIDQNPFRVLGGVPQATTEAQAETDALAMNQRIRTRFPQITMSLSEAQLRSAVRIIPSGQALDRDFLKQWLANKLIETTDIETFEISETDPRFETLLTTIIDDADPFNFANALATLRTILQGRGWTPAEIDQIVEQERARVASKTWSWVVRTMASRIAAFASGGEIFLSRGISQAQRRLNLIHEILHFYDHSDYRDWVNATTAPRFYNEGFTEFLSRLVMTDEEKQGRNSYQDRVDAIEQEVAPFVSEDDIARAYFQGEVWRLEGFSPVSQRIFESQVGLKAGAPRAEEIAQSAASSGIVQVVSPGAHYRFMNLGVDQSNPKPSHEESFRRIYQEFIRDHSNVRVRFVGHASSPGSLNHNLRLSRRRSQAFYEMARRVGVPENQLQEANNPPHQGETIPIAENENVHGRAFNRRVELFITTVSTNEEKEQ